MSILVHGKDYDMLVIGQLILKSYILTFNYENDTLGFLYKPTKQNEDINWICYVISFIGLFVGMVGLGLSVGYTIYYCFEKRDNKTDKVQNENTDKVQSENTN